MCDSRNSGDKDVATVDVHERIPNNDRVAQRNREDLRERGVVAVSLMGSPGCGKMALLEATARALGRAARVGVLARDLATGSDAGRMGASGLVAMSIATSTDCYFDADMVRQGLQKLPPRDLNYLFVDNVGSLVCPPVYDLGQTASVVVLSVAEGEDKPLRYPLIFRSADLVVVTKADLLTQLPEVDINHLEHNLSFVMPRPAMLLVSAKTGLGLDKWLRWLDGVGGRRGTACAVPSTVGVV